MTYEGKPMIENSDRGITLAKPLAWTMLCSVLAAVWWGAALATTQSNMTQAVADSQVALQAVVAQNSDRIRALENGSVAAVTRYEYLKQSMDEIKDQQGETNSLLRQILQGDKP